MANISKRTGGQEAARPQAREWNPWSRWRELAEWDPFGEMRSLLPQRGMEGFNPDFEVRETADGFVFKADLPGVNEDEIDIHVTGNRLTVSGKREAEQRDENDRYFCYECSYGSFSRSFTLPDGVNTDDVKAELKNGVLTLRVPKAPEAQPRRIRVGGGGGGAQQVKPKA